MFALAYVLAVQSQPSDLEVWKWQGLVGGENVRVTASVLLRRRGDEGINLGNLSGTRITLEKRSGSGWSVTDEKAWKAKGEGSNPSEPPIGPTLIPSKLGSSQFDTFGQGTYLPMTGQAGGMRYVVLPLYEQDFRMIDRRVVVLGISGGKFRTVLKQPYDQIDFNPANGVLSTATETSSKGMDPKVFIEAKADRAHIQQWKLGASSAKVVTDKRVKTAPNDRSYFWKAIKRTRPANNWGMIAPTR